MNDAHLHLLVNHIPVLGAVFAFLLGAYGLVRRQPEVVRAALLGLVLVGVGSVVAMQTGERAEEMVEDLAGISEARIHEHEEAAEVANYAAIALGLLALGVLIWRRRQPDVGLAPAGVVLVGALVVIVLMARAASLGGEIRHPEIRADGASVTAPAQVERRDDDD